MIRPWLTDHCLQRIHTGRLYLGVHGTESESQFPSELSFDFVLWFLKSSKHNQCFLSYITCLFYNLCQQFSKYVTKLEPHFTVSYQPSFTLHSQWHKYESELLVWLQLIQCSMHSNSYKHKACNLVAIKNLVSYIEYLSKVYSTFICMMLTVYVINDEKIVSYIYYYVFSHTGCLKTRTVQKHSPECKRYYSINVNNCHCNRRKFIFSTSCSLSPWLVHMSVWMQP